MKYIIIHILQMEQTQKIKNIGKEGQIKDGSPKRSNLAPPPKKK